MAARVLSVNSQSIPCGDAAHSPAPGLLASGSEVLTAQTKTVHSQNTACFFSSRSVCFPLSPTNERHLCGHDGHERHIGIQRQLGHIDDGVGNMIHVNRGFGRE